LCFGVGGLGFKREGEDLETDTGMVSVRICWSIY